MPDIEWKASASGSSWSLLLPIGEATVWWVAEREGHGSTMGYKVSVGRTVLKALSRTPDDAKSRALRLARKLAHDTLAQIGNFDP